MRENMNRQEVIIIDEDEEEVVSETSNSSDSDYISISGEEDVEAVENSSKSSREVDDRPKDAPRIKRFTRGRNDAQADAHQVQVEVEDSESDCEVLSAVQWNEIFSKGKGEKTESLGRTPRRRRFSQGKAQVGGRTLGTTALHRAQHGQKSSSASVKVEISSPVLNGSAAKRSSSPGLQPAKATWTEVAKVSIPDRIRKDEKDAADVGHAVASDASPSAQRDSGQGSPGCPVVLPRPVAGGATPRKAPHLVHLSETGRVFKTATVPGDTSTAGESSKAAASKAAAFDIENCRQPGDTSNSGPATVFDRETRRQTAEFREAEKLEWAARQLELQKQALEVQREKERLKRKRKEAEKQLEMQSRQKQRVLEMRESQKKEEQVLGMKEELRGIVQLELEQRTAECSDMGSLLQKLGILGACAPSAEQVNAGYKKALKTFHPDRASGNGDLRCQVEAEETFKLISKMKSLLPLTVRK